MKINLKDCGFDNHSRVFKRKLSDRIPVEFCEDGLSVELSIDKSIASAESYCICKNEDGFVVKGSDELGLYYGIGKFLHSAKWSDTDFAPVATNGVVSPACSYRAIYFSVHFFNWYQMAPMEEQEEYLEDLLLWGYNVLHCTLPRVNANSFKEEMFVKAADNIKRIILRVPLLTTNAVTIKIAEIIILIKSCLYALKTLSPLITLSAFS